MSDSDCVMTMYLVSQKTGKTAKALQAVELKKPMHIPDADRDFDLGIVIRHSVIGFLVTLLHVLRRTLCTQVLVCNNRGLAVFLDFKYAIHRLGEKM